MGVSNAIWNTEGQAKREAVREMFGRIASRYDLMNGLITFRLHSRWRAFSSSLLQLKPGDKALDICCGTGDFVRPLRRAVTDKGAVVGLDFCLPMLEIAKSKGVAADALLLGDACNLPIASGAYDGATVGWGIRNVPDIDLAHREIARVLKPGARFVSLDMAVPRNGVLRAVSSVFCGRIIPAIGSVFGFREAYTYLPKSTELFKSREMLIESMEKAGFVECRYKDLMLGNICVHWGRKG